MVFLECRTEPEKTELKFGIRSPTSPTGLLHTECACHLEDHAENRRAHDWRSFQLSRMFASAMIEAQIPQEISKRAVYDLENQRVDER